MSKEENQMRAVGDEHLRVEKDARHRGMDGRDKASAHHCVTSVAVFNEGVDKEPEVDAAQKARLAHCSRLSTSSTSGCVKSLSLADEYGEEEPRAAEADIELGVVEEGREDESTEAEAEAAHEAEKQAPRPTGGAAGRGGDGGIGGGSSSGGPSPKHTRGWFQTTEQEEKVTSEMQGRVMLQMFHPDKDENRKANGKKNQKVFRVFKAKRGTIRGTLSVGVFPLGMTYTTKAGPPKETKKTNKGGWNKKQPWTKKADRSTYHKDLKWFSEAAVRNAVKLTLECQMYKNENLQVVDQWPRAVPRDL
jgi:hypothetical protein